MSINFLPDAYSRVTAIEVVVPVSGVSDITDPDTRHTLSPTRVEVHLRLEEDTPRGDRFHSYVAVAGPRRLKSGQLGKPIISTGWNKEHNESWRGNVADRPQWLANVLAANLPDGWDPALLDLAAVS